MGCPVEPRFWVWLMTREGRTIAIGSLLILVGSLDIFDDRHTQGWLAIALGAANLALWAAGWCKNDED
jgi:hypothetical protein